MKCRLFAFAIVVVVLAGQGSVFGEAKRTLLGEKEVTFLAERDDLVIGPREGLFSKLLFEVEKNDLDMLRVEVTYGNGKVDTIPVRHVFKEGSRSRLIDLPGGKRIIRRITFFYRTTGSLREGRALIRVYEQ